MATIDFFLKKWYHKSTDTYIYLPTHTTYIHHHICHVYELTPSDCYRECDALHLLRRADGHHRDEYPHMRMRGRSMRGQSVLRVAEPGWVSIDDTRRSGLNT